MKEKFKQFIFFSLFFTLGNYNITCIYLGLRKLQTARFLCTSTASFFKFKVNDDKIVTCHHFLILFP